MPETFSAVTSAGLGLALGLAVVYLFLRRTAWRPGGGDPVRAVRVHAMVTALIALFASGTAGLTRLSLLDGTAASPDGLSGRSTVLPDGGERIELTGQAAALGWAEAVVIVSGPVLGLVLVYVVAQYTWPRQTGPVRNARLTDRRALDYLPRALSAVAGVVLLAACAGVALAWTTPAVGFRDVTETYEEEHSTSSTEWTELGIRGGGEFAPWLLVALVLIVLGFLVVLRVVSRRPPLGGLHPHDDDLVRRITVNRALRTVVLMLWGVANAAAQAWIEAHSALAHRTQDPLTAGPADTPWPVTVLLPTVGITGAALILLMLAWRSPALRRLGEHTTTGSRPPLPPRTPARPGTAAAARRLRREGALSAWTLAVIAALVTAGPLVNAPPTGQLVWPAVPFGTALVILAVYEIAIRRGHCPRPALSPSLSGTTPRWARWALGISLVLAGAWCLLCLATAVPQTRAAATVGLLAVVLAVGSLAVARLALRRPRLGVASAAADEAIRSAGAERLLALGAAGITAVTAMACHRTVQVWHGFTGGATPTLGVEYLPDPMLMARTVAVVLLSCLVVVFLLWPSVRAARAEDAAPAQPAEPAGARGPQ